MADMKGITCCGDCIYYDWKKKRCKRGTSQDPDPKSPFFADCPLPSVEPERLKGRWELEKYPLTRCTNCGAMRNCESERGWNFCPNCGADMRGESE